jgi:hypothetical protein
MINIGLLAEPRMSINLQNIRSTHVVVAGHIMAVLLLTSMCDFIKKENGLSRIVHPRGKQFAGSQSCSTCHRAIHDDHMLAPHFSTSSQAVEQTVKGSFQPGHNTLKLNQRLEIVMEQTPSGLFQAGFVDGFEVNKKPIDISIGSGRKGQTYLYWEGNELFQLPVSYYTPLETWCNSPGYPTDQILFNRKISGRCLECHGTYMKSEITTQGEAFDRSQMMLGVDCERCHGPAADHVAFHLKFPDESTAKHIVNPQKLSRQQRLDNCALCHSGLRENIKPSFSFIVGDTLDDFSSPGYALDTAAALDVHGNQYGLLTASKCFRMSGMDCSSCHDVHQKESNQLHLFSSRCMSCHKRGSDIFCKQPEVHGLVLSNNCIDCHMPALPSRQVFLQVPDTSKSTPDLVRTHLIATYESEVKLFLDKINKGHSENK